MPFLPVSAFRTRWMRARERSRPPVGFQSPRRLSSLSLTLNDARRDEDQQLAAFVRGRVAAEQPAKERQSVQDGCALVRDLFATDEDSADDRRRPVVHLDLSPRALG